jgi:hypothetical protein
MSSLGQIPRDVVKLPTPLTISGMSLGDALALRRSVREFGSTPLPGYRDCANATRWKLFPGLF